jgi:hypothetical protein
MLSRGIVAEKWESDRVLITGRGRRKSEAKKKAKPTMLVAWIAISGIVNKSRVSNNQHDTFLPSFRSRVGGRLVDPHFGWKEGSEEGQRWSRGAFIPWNSQHIPLSKSLSNLEQHQVMSFPFFGAHSVDARAV